MDHEGRASSAGTKPGVSSAGVRPADLASGVVVRYQVKDVAQSIDFYTRHLGFAIEHAAGPAFASVTRGDLRLLLSGPGSSGSRPLTDGRRQEPGGSNRFVLFVDDIEAHIEALRGAGVRFRTGVEVGPGGKQVQIDDPDGNPIELHEPPAGRT